MNNYKVKNQSNGRGLKGFCTRIALTLIVSQCLFSPLIWSVKSQQTSSKHFSQLLRLVYVLLSYSYLPGRILNEIIDEKPLNVRRALEIIKLKLRFAVFDIIRIEIRSALGCR